MAGFQTHIATSSLLGVAYGATGHLAYGLPLPSCILAGGLCGIAGMLPDLDSDAGVPLRESVNFTAAIVPLLLLDRFKELGLTNEWVVLLCAGCYLSIRFGLAAILNMATVHRGMFHSLPAAAIAGLVTFLLCRNLHGHIALFKSGAVVVGFLSHLLLDEIYSLEPRFGRVRVKKSFGSALKLWGSDMWANVLAYGQLAVLGALVWLEPAMMNRPELDSSNIPQTARELGRSVWERVEEEWRR